jgi:ribosomal protein S16
MLRLVIIAALIVTGSACSRTDLAYRNADRLLGYYAWQTVDAGSAQRERWRPVVETTLRRHRQQELPLIIAYLDLAGRSVTESGASRGAACLVDGARLLYQRHARLAVELAVPLLTGLDTAQISHLARHTAKRQQDAARRYLDPDPEDRKASRQKRFIERIENWTGTLNDEQRQQVRVAVERIPDLSAPWLAYRAQQTDRLLSMLESGADAQALREYLDGWWVRMDGQSPEYRQRWRSARQEFIQLMETLRTTLTEKQRTTLLNRLGDLRNDLAYFLSPDHQPVKLPGLAGCTGAPA